MKVTPENTILAAAIVKSLHELIDEGFVPPITFAAILYGAAVWVGRSDGQTIETLMMGPGEGTVAIHHILYVDAEGRATRSVIENPEAPDSKLLN